MRIFTAIAGSPRNVPLEHRVYNTTAFFSTVVMACAFVMNEISGFPPEFDLILLGFGVIFGSLYYIARFKGYYYTSRGILIGFSVLLAPIAWHYNQGITGTSTFYFFTFVLLMIATLNRSKYIFGVLFVLYIALLSILEQYLPWFVIPFENERIEYQDFLFSFIITSTIFVIGAIGLKGSYEQERNRALKQGDEAARHRDKLESLNAELAQHNTLISAQKEALEDLNSVNNKLFSIISHDLRSPLANLETLVQVITFSDPTPDESKRLMQGIQRELQNTSELLENLLQWAKKQREGLKISFSEFQLKALVEENIRLIQKRAGSKGIRLKNKIIASAYVNADRDMVGLIIRNLLSNAVKFCSVNDTVSFSCEIEEEKLQIRVSDTGMGINQEDQKRLFQTIDFTQRGTEGEKGTGLGLMLCKEFVEKNNGEIWFESEHGKGTTFFFTLPLANMAFEFSPVE